jgi:hypothetical protein
MIVASTILAQLKMYSQKLVIGIINYKKWRIQNRSPRKSHACVPLKEVRVYIQRNSVLDSGELDFSSLKKFISVPDY